MTPKKLYLCPQKLQAKLLIGWWTVGDLCITLVLLLAFFLTGYAPFFLALCLGYLFLSLRFDGKSNLLGGLKRHMLYHTTHQLFVKTVKEQNKPHKKALPIQRVIDFKLEDNYVISDGHYVYFYRYYAPNTHIMTDDEIQSEIGKLGRLFDTLKCSFTLFATDKVENLEAIKNYYLSLPVRYEYINSEIVESIERSDVESSAVQRAYKDVTLAATHFRNAAELGNEFAQYKLAKAYLQGKGIEASTPQAIALFSRLVQSKNKMAKDAKLDIWSEYYLGKIYLYGLGIERDPAKGLELLEHAAQNDCEPAEKLLQRYKQYRAKSTVQSVQSLIMRIADSLQADTTQTKNYRTTTRTRYERLRQAEKHQDQRTEEMYY